MSVVEADGTERDVAVLAGEGFAAEGIGAVLGVRGRLRVGARVGRPGAVERAGTRLDVIGGADAGRTMRVSRQTCTLGREPGCDLVLADPEVSRRHARLVLTEAGAVLHDLGSTNGTSIDGQRVGEHGCALRTGQVVRVGDTFLALADNARAPASVRNGPPGHLMVNRRPRSDPAPPVRYVDIPVAPTAHPARHVQWFAALLPALAGACLAIIFGSLQFLAFALLGPLAVLASAGGDQLHRRRDGRRRGRAYRRAAAVAGARIETALHEEAVQRRSDAPDPAALLRIARTPLDRVWERRPGDADLLRVRLGLAPQPASLRARADAAESSAGVVDAVPVCVDLRDGPLGIAGPRRPALGLAWWVVAQLATLVSPAYVEIVVLLDDDPGSAWAWLRWLPHLRGRVADTATGRARLVAELAELVAARRAERAPVTSWTIVLVDRASRLGDLPQLATVLSDGLSAGVSAVCIDDYETGLPAACRSVARSVGETGARIVIGDGRDAVVAVSDRVGRVWADELARAVAPLLDAAADPAGSLPSSCRLVDLLGGTMPDADDVLARWRLSSGYPQAVLGVGADGPLVVDLARDGPHLLVGGTTGAGKSELLQTLVTSLAMTSPPDEITFVLVDYKGGSAFSDCALLPHVSGLVTDLDEALTRRALQSLQAELRRREQLFADVGAADLTAYRALSPKQPVARLVLVVDEFAALSTELPAFVQGLVGIAQRGRSLGVHLVLATQRPAGVVSSEIRANTALRIALRVTDQADSSDVIDVPDAAHLDRGLPGRAIVRCGTTTTPIQIARVTGPVVPAGEPRVAPLGPWRSLAPERASDGVSELTLLVQAAVAAAVRAALPAVRRPWLPPLPWLLMPRSLASTGARTRIPIGLIDLPDEQRQRVFDLDLGAGGSLLVAGGARSGRTTTLLSTALAAANRLSPEELHLYAVDPGGGLDVLRRLPHTGTVAADLAVGATLLDRLCAQVTSRRATAGRCRPEAMILLVDGWEAFVAAAEDVDGGRAIEQLLSLVRDGPGGRLTTVVSGDRSTLAPRIAGHFDTRLVLRLVDPSDYQLAGIRAPTTPPTGPGRAQLAPDGTHLQLAAAGTTSGQLEAAADRCVARWTRLPVAGGVAVGAGGVAVGAVGDVAGAARDVTGHAAGVAAPIRLRPLPNRVALSAIAGPPGHCLLGVGGPTAAAVTVDLVNDAVRLLVAGPPRSGRSTLLLSILGQLARNAITVTVAAPARSPLRTAALVLAAELPGVEVFDPRTDCSKPAPPDLLLVDDSDAFADTAIGDVLADWARRDDISVVVAARSAEVALSFRGVSAEVRRSHCGVLLQPGPVDGELLGVRLAHTRKAGPPGRGVVVGDPAWGTMFADGPIAIQVATP